MIKLIKKPCFAIFMLLATFGLFSQVYAGININKPMTRAIFQRDIFDIAMVPVEGTIIGITFTSIEARYVLADDPAQYGLWQQMNVVSSDYDGPLDVPAGGWYTIEVRALNNVTTAAETSVLKIGIGDIFITAGQSNSTNCGDTPMTPAYDTISAWTGSAWRHAYDPQPICYGAADICSTTPGYQASPWSRLGDILAEELDVPIGFISVGYGGTAISQWHPTGGTLYPRIQGALTDVAQRWYSCDSLASGRERCTGRDQRSNLRRYFEADSRAVTY